MRYLSVFLSAAVCVCLAQDKSAGARVEMKNAKGETVGTLRAAAVRGGGVRFTGELKGLPPGELGFHIHAAGKCEPPDFTTAGGHFNPTSMKHGHADQGGHAGDLGNLKVDANGRAKVNVLAKGVSLGDGPNSLFQEAGTSVMVHAKTDDLKTDPAGNAGPRVACGVVSK